MNKLIATRKYALDAEKHVFGREPREEAHRSLLLRLVQRAPRPPPSGSRNRHYRAVSREPIDEDWDLLVSVTVRPGQRPTRIELRGLKVVPSGSFAF
jgi:hypothetical protein